MTKQSSDDLPFAERLFTSTQTRQILQDGKTKFFTQDLPELEAFLDGNKLKITGRSILALIRKRLAAGRQPRPIRQLRKSKIESQPSGEVT